MKEKRCAIWRHWIVVNWRYWCGSVLLLVGVIALDRLTKWWALRTCMVPRAVFSWLSCSVAFNTGSMASLFCPQSAVGFWLLVLGILIVLTFVIGWMVSRARKGQSIGGYVAIIAGSLSNLFDRFWYKGVIDFIDVHYGGWHYPTFNLADIAIVCGVVWVLFNEYRVQISS